MMSSNKNNSFQPSKRPHFVGTLEDKHLCTKCNLALFVPVQTNCGHRYCKICFEELRTASDEPRCVGLDPDCEDIILDQVFEDKGTLKELSQLHVFCPHKSRGCKVTCSWRTLQNHVEECAFSPQSCPSQGCDTAGTRAEISTHLNVCQYLVLICELCTGSFPRSRYEKHRECCEKERHPCKYRKYGCRFEGFNNEILAHHNESSIHLDLMMKRNDEMEQKLHQVDTELRRLTVENQSRTETITNVEANAMQNETISQLENTTTQQSKIIAQLQDMLRMLVPRVENVEQDISSRNGQPGNEKINSMESTLHMHDRRIAEYDIRFRCIETASYTGELIWKISNYSRRKQDALDGRILSLFSQPFYTSPFGYKMCARVYLNGDGMGSNTHISLFFVVMRGEYDQLLQWPFRHKVTLMLLDQQGGNKHINDSFRPDPTSSSFRKPVGEMNIASGCPLFACQTKVGSEPYLVNDTLFIKVLVQAENR